MNAKELVSKIDVLIDESKSAVFVTLDDAGMSQSRWMTPVLIKHRGNCIYCFSAPGARKIKQIEVNDRVEWMIQRRDLREVVNLKGRCSVVNNPALKGELLEVLGPRVETFWRANAPSEDYVILETVIDEGEYFEPIRGRREKVEF